MSSLPPQLPTAPPPTAAPVAPKFLSPMLLSVLVVCIVSALSWALLAALAVPLRQAAWLQDLLGDAPLEWLSPSLRWLGHHVVATSLWMLAICVAGVAASWGMLYRQRWALWLFIVVLVVTALLNFAGAWLVDEAFAHGIAYLTAHLDDPDLTAYMDATELRQLKHELLMHRILYTGMSVLTALTFAGLHGWLVVRLLRADVQAWFGR